MLHDAALVIERGRVAWVGPARRAPAADASYDVGGRAVVPGFVDSHSHLVFAGDRAEEFAARMTGTSYTAGGIRGTVAATRAATDEQLAANLARLVDEMRRQGTTTVEVKSGYGLTVHDEARSLAIARQVTQETTFLGAHVVPPEYADDPAGYVDLVTGPMLAACAPHARWVDVVLRARRLRRGPGEGGSPGRAAAGGLRGQAARQPARARARVSGWPASSGWSPSTTAPTCRTPTSTHSRPAVRPPPCCRGSSSRPGRRTRTPVASSTQASRVAIASDCNPGSCYTSSMPLCIALAVREMGMSPAEALAAATMGGARALGRDDVGRLGVGACGGRRRARGAVVRPPRLPAGRPAGPRDLRPRPPHRLRVR